MRVFDINLRQHFYDRDLIEESLHLTDVLKINEDELVVLSDYFQFSRNEIEACQAIRDRFKLDLVVLTKGENGSYIICQDQAYYQETPKVEVEDTVGAGDSFTAALVMGLLKNLPIPLIHKKAVDLTAFVCSQKGATPGLPEELKF